MKGRKNHWVGILVSLTLLACGKEDIGLIRVDKEWGKGGEVDYKEAVKELDYVELAGINWATCNMGAARPELYGNLYTWIYEAVKIQDSLKGTGWRLPTRNEFQKLIDNCEWEHQTTPLVMEYSWYVEGYKVRDRQNGNSIFLPEAGKVYPNHDVEWGDGFYWTSEILMMKYTWYLEFNDRWMRMSMAEDYYTGMSIRLVFDPKY